ncbi:MAG: stage II sporulation protein R [Evtepia gabavorous]
MTALHSFSFPWRRVLALFFAFLVCTALWAEATQAQLAEKVIRLHVLANSDSQADQTLKLQVRDKILAQTASCSPARNPQPKPPPFYRTTWTHWPRPPPRKSPPGAITTL